MKCTVGACDILKVKNALLKPVNCGTESTFRRLLCYGCVYVLCSACCLLFWVLNKTPATISELSRAHCSTRPVFAQRR